MSDVEKQAALKMVGLGKQEMKELQNEMQVLQEDLRDVRYELASAQKSAWAASESSEK